MNWQVIEADCVEQMRSMDEASIDAIVCDPPYSLGFMGKAWDKNRNHGPWATEALRILKPGGHLLAFGGTRTYHRLACAVEDAGFEIRDSLVWLYGSGFPKSLDVSKAIDKAAGAEREVVGKTGRATGPSQAGENGIGTFKETNWEQSDDLTAPATPEAQKWNGWGTALKPAHEPIVVARKPLTGTVAQNVTEHGTGALNIDGCRVEGQPHAGGAHGVTIYGSDGNYEPGPNVEGNSNGRWPPNVALSPEAAAELDEQSGDKSRFFYCAKAAKVERNLGLADPKNTHPTVKPVSLMRWLVRLVVPPEGTVLDPFAGSGTTGCAAVLEGFDFIGIEREPEYVEIAEARIAHVGEQEEQLGLAA